MDILQSLMPEKTDHEDAAREATISGIATLDQPNIQVPIPITATKIASSPHLLWAGLRSIVDPVTMKDNGNSVKKAMET